MLGKRRTSQRQAGINPLSGPHPTLTPDPADGTASSWGHGDYMGTYTVIMTRTDSMKINMIIVPKNDSMCTLKMSYHHAPNNNSMTTFMI